MSEASTSSGPDDGSGEPSPSTGEFAWMGTYLNVASEPVAAPVPSPARGRGARPIGLVSALTGLALVAVVGTSTYAVATKDQIPPIGVAASPGAQSADDGAQVSPTPAPRATSSEAVAPAAAQPFAASTPAQPSAAPTPTRSALAPASALVVATAQPRPTQSQPRSSTPSRPQAESKRPTPAPAAAKPKPAAAPKTTVPAEPKATAHQLAPAQTWRPTTAQRERWRAEATTLLNEARHQIHQERHKRK